MPWALIQTASQATWDDYQRVSQEVGDEIPEGLILHVAGPYDGHWRSVSVWESELAYTRFRDERVVPAVQRTLSADLAGAGPPPSESFEVQHMLGR